MLALPVHFGIVGSRSRLWNQGCKAETDESRYRDDVRMNVVYLDGGNSLPEGNKGDALMLHVVSDKLRSILPHAGQAIRPGATDFEGRCHFGLKQLLWPKRWNRLSGNIGYYVLHRYRHQIGLAAEDDLGAVVNFMGFRYAYMGEVETEKDANIAEKRRARGVKHIFLPQAYGPFKNDNQRHHARRLLGAADLVTARDTQSQTYLKEILGDDFEVPVFPDITVGMAGTVPDIELPDDFMVIVPNHWMLLRTAKEEQASYLDFLNHTITIATEQGLSVLLLNHAPFQDTEIINQLVEQNRKRPVSYLAETDPLRLKGIVSRARLLIGSRYHAIVAALSQSVPAIGTSWSHKYQGLYGDYGIDELLLSPTDSRDQVAGVMNRVLSGATRDECVAQLQAANHRLASQSAAMWDLVAQKLTA